MIELNLLPEEAKKKKRMKIELPEIPLIPITASFIGILIVLQVILVGLIFISKARLAALDKTWLLLTPKKTELDSIKQSILITNKKIQAIDDLMEKRLSWARLLNELSASLTPNIWLRELSYSEKPEASASGNKAYVLKLSGSAVAKEEEATRDIARFIKSLKGNLEFFKYFDDVELVSIKKGSEAGHDLMDFTLVSTFKREVKGN